MTTATRLFSAPLWATVLTLSCVTVRAQEENNTRTQQQRLGWQVVDVSFPGGTLAEFVAAVRGAGDKVNILLQDGAQKVKVPALMMKDVEVGAALSAVAEVVDEDYSVRVKTHRQNTGQPVHTVRFELRGKSRIVSMTSANQAPSPAPTVRVFSLRGLTEGLPGDPVKSNLTVSAETAITAVNTGLELAASGKGTYKPEIKYHADSGLIFVRGTRAQAEIVNSVLSRISDDVERARVSARNAQRKPA